MNTSEKWPKYSPTNKKQSAVDIVINRIVDDVLTGRYKPGDKLPTEMQLAEMMSMSKNTVREAIKILVAYGAVEIRRPEGTFITHSFTPKMLNPVIYSLLFSKSNADDLLGLRRMIDTGVFLLIIDRGLDKEDEAALEAQHMPVIILGGIYGGIFTPTEAAAVSAIYGLIVGMFIYKTLRFKEIVVILRQSVSQTAVVMLIIGCAAVFGKVLTFTGLASDASQSLISIAHGNKYTFLLMVNIILIIAGCFIDANSALYILCPILFPIAKTLGIDAVHLGAVMTVNLALGLITPPVGVNLFTGCGVAGITLTDMVKKIWPFVIAVLIVLLLVTYIPQISTILPSLMVK